MDMYIDMRHDMARELRHGLFIQHCNESYELVLIDLKTTRKGVSWQHMCYASDAPRLVRATRAGLLLVLRALACAALVGQLPFSSAACSAHANQYGL